MKRPHSISMIAPLVIAMAIAVGCSPNPTNPTPTGITCSGTSGGLIVSPGVDNTPKENRYTLAAPSSTASCSDHTGLGLTSARFTRFSVTFPEIACLVILGQTAEGSATIRWSDGTSSNATATATLDAAFDGTLHLAISSGHFAGASTTTRFHAAPTTGDCGTTPITGESVQTEAFTLAATR